MPQRNERFPQGAFLQNDSFGTFRDVGAQLGTVITTSLLREQGLIERAVRTLQADPGSYASSREKEGPLQLEEAEAVASIETASLLLEHPYLGIITPTFADLYRFMRTLELSTGVERGGVTLLVGSGKTLPEVLAMYVESPTPEMVGTLHDRESVLMERVMDLMRIGDGDYNFSQPAMKEGKVFAIEPNLRNPAEMQAIENMRRIASAVTTDMLEFVPTTLGDALAAERTPFDIDTILFHRTEPDIFYLQQKGDRPITRSDRRSMQREGKKGMDKIFRTLFNHLAPNGHIVLTVGEGNNPIQLQQRKDLVIDATDALSRLRGAHAVGAIPHLFQSGTQEERLFGNKGVGMVGYTAFAKNNTDFIITFLICLI